MRGLILAFVVATALVAASRADAEDFWFVDAAQDRSAAVLIDAETISVSGVLVSAWDLVVFRTPERDGSAFYKALTQYNCSSKQYNSLAFVKYNAEGGTVTQQQSSFQSWQYIVPGSMGDSELRFACSDQSARAGLGVELTSVRSTNEAVTLEVTLLNAAGSSASAAAADAAHAAAASPTAHHAKNVPHYYHPQGQ
jgi:hypothetical protein